MPRLHAPRLRPRRACLAWAIGAWALTSVAACVDPGVPEDLGILADGGVRDQGALDGAGPDAAPDLGLVDFGVLPDLGIPPDQDTDGDGLCDTREITRGTRVDVADTDGDEVTDYYEFILGTDPRNPASPTVAELVFLSEGAGAGASVAVRRTFTGAGEDFSGSFVALPVSDPEGLSGASFYASSVATSAQPMGNVAFADAEMERFYGVVGRTELGFEVSLAVPPGFLPRGCGRYYPIRYDIKRSDGRFVGADRRFVVVLPVGGNFADGPWCVPTRCI